VGSSRQQIEHDRKKRAGQEIIADEREEQADWWRQMKQKSNIAVQLGGDGGGSGGGRLDLPFAQCILHAPV